MAEGFLSRWSERKQALRAGRTPAEPPVTPAPSGMAPVPVAPTNAAVHGGANADIAEPVPAPAPPSMEDVERLTPQSDFKAFVARDVAPEVRNAALKKLFADPHFNVMDRLDTYIDDYSLADPVPESMLRQMVSAKFLRLFEDEKQEEGVDRDQTLRRGEFPDTKQ